LNAQFELPRVGGSRWQLLARLPAAAIADWLQTRSPLSFDAAVQQQRSNNSENSGGNNTKIRTKTASCIGNEIGSGVGSIGSNGQKFAKARNFGLDFSDPPPARPQQTLTRLSASLWSLPRSRAKMLENR